MKRWIAPADLLIVALLVLGAVWAVFARLADTDSLVSDPYRECLASSLAGEPIEILSGAPYSWLTTYAEHPLPDLPLGWQDLPASPSSSLHPAAAAGFRRNLRLERVAPLAPGKPAAVRIQVTVLSTGEGSTPAPAVVADRLVFEEAP